MERLRQRGRTLDPRYLARPKIEFGLQFYWDAFWTLHGDRQSGFGLGPIPFSAMDRFAARYGISDTDEFDRFQELIRAMDTAYLAQRSGSGGGTVVEEADATDVAGVRQLLKRLGGRRQSGEPPPTKR